MKNVTNNELKNLITTASRMVEAGIKMSAQDTTKLNGYIAEAKVRGL